MNPSSSEEGAAETICDELTTAAIPHPSVPLGEEKENVGDKGEPGEKGGVRGQFTLIC